MILLPLLVAIAMYLAWRLWLKLHGVNWKPQGRWVPRTAAAEEYWSTLRQPSTGQKIMLGIIGLVVVAAEVVFLVWAVRRN
ncbi:MAG: hypothetical protein U0446_12360 [Dehalococcoidia bacterium]